MNIPGWAFNLMVLGAALLLFGGMALILGVLYWFSPSRKQKAMGGQGTGDREQDTSSLIPHPSSLPSNRPNSFGAAQRPGAFGSQGIARSQSANWRDIPQNERGASFFSGRPARVGEMHATTVSVGGRRRRVLVDDDDWAILQMGQMPPFHVFYYNGGYVPWYAYPDYSPYMDYDVPPGNFVPYNQVEPQYWEQTPPVADYAYTPDQENYQDYAAGAAMGAIDTGNTVAFEDVYQPSLPDNQFTPDPAYLNAPNVDPLGDPGIATGNIDPLGDPGASLSDFGTVDMSSSFDASGFDSGSGSFDAS